MKLEVGKYYRTRDGRKVGPMVRWHDSGVFPFEINDTTNTHWPDVNRQLWSEDGCGDEGLHLIAEWTDEPAPETARSNKYARTIKGASVDVYDILHAFGVTCPATQHAIKKLLMPGQRGGKTKAQDLREALASVQRAIELEDGQ